MMNIKLQITNYKLQIFAGIFFVLLFYILYSIFYIPSAIAACQTQTNATTRRAEGLISSVQDILPSTIFGNPTGTCVIDPKAVIPPYQIYSYDDLKSIFYDQSKSNNKKQAAISALPVFSGDGIYVTTGDLTVSGSPGGNGTQVIFVPGDLFITSNVIYGTNTSGLVFAVKGNINIDSTVTQINAVLISNKIICTAFQGGVCPASNIPTSQLVVNGSLISLSPDPGNIIAFRRDLGASNDTQPAEVINQQVKYLVILKDLFSLNPTYRIEDAIVPFPPAAGSNLGVNCTPESNPVYTGAPVNWTANVVGSGSYIYLWSGASITQTTVNPTQVTYNSPGTQTATLTVTDNVTQASTSVTCTQLTVNTAPPPTINNCTTTAVSPVANNTSITWNAVVSGGAAPLTYNWTVTDNTPEYSTGTTASTTKTFPAGGFKTATVRVTDNLGRASTPATMSCTVTPTSVFVHYPYNRVFISALGNYTGNLGGTAGADSTCQTLANNANLAGTWGAWLSSSTSNAGTRLTPTDTTLPYRRVNGTTAIAANWAAFKNSNNVSFSNTISTDQNGTAASDGNRTITASDYTGTYSTSGGSADCTAFTSTSAGSVRNGQYSQTNKNFTDTGGSSCAGPYHLYCLEK